MYALKKMLDDLVDYVYKDDPLLPKYHGFFVKVVETRTYDSRHGDYNPSDGVIRVMNLYRQNDFILLCCVHELAHHIDHVRDGAAGHGPSFYRAYRELLYAALDTGIITTETVNTLNDSADRNKVRKLLQEYVPHVSGIRDELRQIVVKNGFDAKDELRKRGYRYSVYNKTWQLSVPCDALPEEEEWLKANCVQYTLLGSVAVSVQKELVVEVSGETYPYRDKLRDMGFHYNKEAKVWKKKCASEKEARTKASLIERSMSGTHTHLKYV